MSLSPQTRKRLPNIKAGLLRGDNYTTIGKACGVTERTIDRDTKVWFASEDFTVWIKTLWIELHGKIVSEEPVEAYRQVSRLFTRMITQKAEVKTETKIKGKIEVPQLEGLDPEAVFATVKNLMAKEERKLRPTSTDAIQSPEDSA